MDERLIIKHFGPISELDIQIKQLTFFIGTQGSGKSTISKVLTAFRDIFWRIEILKADEQTQNEENDYVNILKQFQHFGIDRYFCDASYIQYTDKTISMTFENGQLSYAIPTSLGISKAQLITQYQKELYDFSKQFLQHLGYQDIGEISGKESDMRIFFEGLRTLLYIPSERIIVGQLSSAIASIILSGVPLADVLLGYMSFFEKAKKEFPTYKIPFLNAEYKIMDGKDSIVVTTGERPTELPLAACSSGLQSVLPMLMIIEYCTKVNCFDSFVVEEPEQGLFPTNQIELLKFLLSKVSGEYNMVITTHSPYLLSALNNYLYAGELKRRKTINKKKLNRIIPKNLQLDVHNCAVYALENGDKSPYCQPIISEDTGLIDFNYLDAVSIMMNDEFNQLQDLDLSATDE